MTTLENLPSQSGEWRLLPDRSTIGFKNSTLWGIATVNGRFTEFSGRGRVTDDGGVSGRVDVVTASLKTGIGKRDSHLRSSDFFDVEKFPDLTVTVTAADPAGAGVFDVQATLTSRGNTLPIALPVTVQVLDDGAIRVTGQTTVDRTAFGVSGNMVGMMGTTTTLLGDVVFVRAAAQDNSST